jgi:hypothetical protein
LLILLCSLFLIDLASFTIDPTTEFVHFHITETWVMQALNSVFLNRLSPGNLFLQPEFTPSLDSALDILFSSTPSKDKALEFATLFLIATVYGNRPLRDLLVALQVPLDKIPDAVLDAVVPASRLPLNPNPNIRKSPAQMIEAVTESCNRFLLTDDARLGPDTVARCVDISNPKVSSYSFHSLLLCLLFSPHLSHFLSDQHSAQHGMEVRRKGGGERRFFQRIFEPAEVPEYLFNFNRLFSHSIVRFFLLHLPCPFPHPF